MTEQLGAAAHYRRRAAQVRAEADKVTLNGIRTQFLMIATYYEEMADVIEGPKRD